MKFPRFKMVFALLISFLLLPILLEAQQYHIKSFTTQNGLSTDSLNMIYQTSDGFMVMGTKNDGFLRFDGKTSQTYNNQAGTNGNHITAMFEDNQRHLWVATDAGGLGRLKADSIYYPYKGRRIQHQRITDIKQDEFHRLWLATQSQGIFVGNEFGQITAQEGLPSDTIHDLLLLNSNKMLAATSNGLAIINPQTMIVEEVLDTTNQFNCRVVFAKSRSEIWVGTDDGVLKISGEDELKHYRSFKGESIGVVSDVIKSGTGSIMIGTASNGIFEIEGALVNHITTENNLPDDAITDLFKDDENRTWVATKSGGASLFLDESFVHYSTKKELGSDNILAVQTDNNILWLGTPSGLGRLDTGSMEFRMVVDDSVNAVWDIRELASHQLLLVGDEGLYYFDKQSQSAEKLVFKNGNAIEHILDIHPLNDNRLFLGTNRGLYILQNRTIYPLENPLISKSVIWDIMEDRSGKIWISTNKGMVLYHDRAFSRIDPLEKNGYNGLLRYAVEDEKESIWLGSNQGIIQMQNTSEGWKITSFDNSNGLFSLNTQFLKIDKHQQLWHGTAAGLHKLDLAEYHNSDEMDITHYGLNFRGLGMEFNHGAVAEDSEGVIWFGSQEGLLKYDPKHEVQDRYGPEVYFTDINLGIDHEDGFEYKTSIELDYPVASPSKIDLAHWENNLNFTFEGIDYQNKENIRYRYTLQGADTSDSSWSELTNSNNVQYENLEPGDYKFLVEARDANEVWSAQPAAIQFTISPPIWRTYWFNGTLIAALLGLFYGVSRIWLNTYEKKKLKRLVDHQTRELRQGLKEKEVLLAEIHHRVKNNLAVISGLLELQQDSVMEPPAERALVEAQSRIQSIAMIHEKLYQNDTLANINFKDYIEQLAEMIAHSHHNNECEIELIINTEDIAITIDQSIPCGLILNEVLSNAYEHAFTEQEEGRICVSLTEVNRQVMMIIRDNGKGLPGNFEERQSQRLGYTLVKTLTQQLSGVSTITNREGVYFEIRFPKATKNKGHLI